MRIVNWLSVCVSLLALGCSSNASTPLVPGAEGTQAAAIDPLLDRFIQGSPASCRWLGLHDACDGKVADYSEAGIQRRITFLQAAERELVAIDQRPLDADGRLDVTLLSLAVREELFRLVDLELFRRRPQFYDELFGVDAYLVREYAPLDDRARALLRHVNASLPQTEHIKKNLRGPLPRTFVETDIGIFNGYGEYLRGDVVKILGGVADVALRDTTIAAVRKLATAAEEIAAHLEKVELPRADESHVLGAPRYKKLLAVQEALDIDLGEFMALAEADLRQNKALYEALEAKGTVQTRPEAARLLDAARKVTAESKVFIEKRGVVTIPAGGKLEITETPPFMQWNSAFLNGTGPFDRSDLTSFYYITLPNPKWSAKEQEEYVMTYGNLLSTSVHEVYPGHFLQGLWARNAPTRAQRMLGSYSFIEGWAHYAEQMMVDEGFGAEDPQNKLGQLSDALLRNCRFVVSIALHTSGMTLAQAEERFVNDCKQDRKTARQQAFRGTFDPGYFAYTLGKIQILELRERAKRALGAAFDLKKFHDALLAHGNPPVPLVRERVLRELGVNSLGLPK